MKKIVFANAPINSGNKGCSALSIAAMYIIDAIFKEKGEEYQIYLTDSKIKTLGETCYQVSDYGKLNFIVCQYPPKIRENSIRGFLHRSYINKINDVFKNADYILDIGEGDSFADIYGERRFEEKDLIHQIAIKYKKPYCLLPQTIGPFDDSLIRGKAVKSITNASLVMPRDKQSLDYIKEIAPNIKDLKEYIDVAFFLPYKKIRFSSNNIHVGLNISALLWNGGYTRNNQFNLKIDYQGVVKNIINYFLSIPNVVLHLVPHVVLQERNIENDYEICYDLWKEYHNSNVLLAPFALDPVEIKSYIAGLDFFMGARMHATIGAFSSGVPVVPMAYSRKFNGLFEDTLDYHFMSDLKKQTTDEVLSTIKDAFAKRSELNDIINDRMKTVVKERERLLYDDLRKFFKLA